MLLDSPPARRQRRSADIRALLLDTAERLFSERGYFGASVRDITDAAGLRLASVNYHFGSKEALLGEVVRRRAVILRDNRLATLKAALRQGGDVEARLRAIVTAFVGPMIVRCLEGGEPWRRYFVLIAQLTTLPANPEDRLDYFDEVARAYIEAFQALSPQVTPFRAHATFQFMLGVALSVVCDNRHLDRLSAGRFHSSDFQALAAPLAEYLTAGALAGLGLREHGT
ncbi:MAG TPA: TetR/AcrR family transcriptional regulator [Caulobacteraceae bacterium]|nr:TetR/AcrR family transcriptional regulator [Caulobacteraceae bacterium]